MRILVEHIANVVVGMTARELIVEAHRLDAMATAGPWETTIEGFVFSTADGSEVSEVSCTRGRRENLEFIAASRTMIVLLANALEKALK